MLVYKAKHGVSMTAAAIQTFVVRRSGSHLRPKVSQDQNLRLWHERATGGRSFRSDGVDFFGPGTRPDVCHRTGTTSGCCRSPGPWG